MPLPLSKAVKCRMSLVLLAGCARAALGSVADGLVPGRAWLDLPVALVDRQPRPRYSTHMYAPAPACPVSLVLAYGMRKPAKRDCPWIFGGRRSSKDRCPPVPAISF